MSYHVTPYHIMSHHIITCHIMSYLSYHSSSSALPSGQQTLSFGGGAAAAGSAASGPKSEAERKAEVLSEIRKYLLSPGPDLVVADEAHLIKDNRGATRNALTKIQTRRRIALTGSPLQNNLEEYWCMVNFVRPRFLGTSAAYIRRLPLTNPFISHPFIHLLTHLPPLYPPSPSHLPLSNPPPPL